MSAMPARVQRLVQVKRHPFTVTDFYKMLHAGILTEDDRVELIDGEIVDMAPIGSRHAACVDRLAQLLIRKLRELAIVRVQNPLRLDERTEPLPDLALVAPRKDYYRAAHPTPADTLLVVEVTETTADFDRRVKAQLYARAGIREFWLIDLRAQHVEVFRTPSPAGYHEASTMRRGKKLKLLANQGFELAVNDILG